MMIFGRGCPGQWVEPCCGLPHLAEPTQSYFSEPTCYISAIWACPPIGSRDILAKCSQSYDHLMTIIFWLQVFWQRVGIPCFSLIIPLSGGAEIKPYFALFGSSAICTNSLFLCFHSALLVPLTASGLASLVSALSNGGKCGLVWWPLEVSMAHQVSETSDRESEDWHWHAIRHQQQPPLWWEPSSTALPKSKNQSQAFPKCYRPDPPLSLLAAPKSH